MELLYNCFFQQCHGSKRRSYAFLKGSRIGKSMLIWQSKFWRVTADTGNIPKLNVIFFFNL